MTIEACIAHAIHKDLDILEALPDVYEVPIEELEPHIDGYIQNLQQSLVKAIKTLGEPYIKAKDAADESEAMASLTQNSRENAGTTSLGALLRAKLDNN